MTVSRAWDGAGHLYVYAPAFHKHLCPDYLFLPFFFAPERLLVAANSLSVMCSGAMERMPQLPPGDPLPLIQPNRSLNLRILLSPS